MTPSSNYLLSLFRAGIGLRSEYVVAPEAEEWKGIIDISFDQGVDAISVDGYNSLARTENCLLKSEELE